MRRKQAQTPGPLSPSNLSTDSDAPKSPASTGAMDDLLQKLRAAKPEARDQRDRRRRARLKDKHQVRVASGQQIPELGVNMEDEGATELGDEEAKEKGILSPTSDTTDAEPLAPSILSPTSATAAAAAGDTDIADRAAAMLEGLQSGGAGGLNKDGSLSVRRRRESADTERQRRRNRRNQASSTRTEDGGLMSPDPILEVEGEEEGAGAGEAGSKDAAAGAGEVEAEAEVRTVVHPPSPERGGDGG